MLGERPSLTQCMFLPVADDDRGSILVSYQVQAGEMAQQLRAQATTIRHALRALSHLLYQ